MSHLTFTSEELRQAQQDLGLSDSQLAAMLGCDEQHVRRMKVRDQNAGSWRPVKPWHARLLRAYLDGYRPADWPAADQAG